MSSLNGNYSVRRPAVSRIHSAILLWSTPQIDNRPGTKPLNWTLRRTHSQVTDETIALFLFLTKPFKVALSLAWHCLRLSCASCLPERSEGRTSYPLKSVGGRCHSSLAKPFVMQEVISGRLTRGDLESWMIQVLHWEYIQSTSAVIFNKYIRIISECCACVQLGGGGGINATALIGY